MADRNRTLDSATTAYCAVMDIDALLDSEDELAQEGNAYLDSRYYDALALASACLKALIDVYEDHDLASRDSHTSAADDAAALYDVLNLIHLRVA